MEGQASVDGWSGATPRSAIDAVSGATAVAERRVASGLTLTRAPREGLAWGGGGSFSGERDYLGRSAFAHGRVDLMDRMVTLSGQLGAQHDENGRRPGEEAWALTADLGWTQALSRRDSLALRVSGSQWWCGPNLGCQASPWRHTLWQPAGDELLGPVLLRERHPDTRGRLAASARWSHAFGPRLAVHFTQRGYADTWRQRGGTSWLAVAGSAADDRLALRLEGRFTAQSAADFYAPLHAEALSWRSSDRELGAMWGGQAGLRAGWTFDALPGLTGLTLNGHLARATWFYGDYPAIPERRAWIGGGGIDVAF